MLVNWMAKVWHTAIICATTLLTEKSGVRSAVNSIEEFYRREVTNDENDARLLLYTSKHLLLYILYQHHTTSYAILTVQPPHKIQNIPLTQHTQLVEWSVLYTWEPAQHLPPPKSRAQKKLSHPKTITREEGFMCLRESVFSLMVSRYGSFCVKKLWLAQDSSGTSPLLI